MTIFHPDLRSQLNAAADLAWLKTVTTMLWAATNTEGNADENLDLLNNQYKALPKYAATSNAVRATAGAIYRHCKAVVMHEEQPGDVLPIIANYAGEGAGPDEVLARFDSWMTIVHPDLRSQLNAAADLAWLKTVATMLWAATNTEGNADENLDLLNNQYKALPKYAATSNAVRATAG
ncbi:hypothetical protein C6558_38930, partial [Ensifer sp. NM-2]|uniref:hypothetical protein n=1 Tax=Ensifer sp. NM-2 TaxID=2109730 RepID=UPI000D4605BA